MKQTYLWVVLGVAIMLGIVWQFYPLPNASLRMNSLPYVGPNFAGEEVPLSPMEKEYFANVGIVKRLYKINNQLFLVTALDGTNNRHAVHDPYYCFRGSGWDMVHEEDFSMPRGTAKLVELKKGDQRKAALYWFSDGKEVYGQPTKYWIQTTLRRLTLGWTGEEPILIMFQPVNATQDIDWKQVLNTFYPILKI